MDVVMLVVSCLAYAIGGVWTSVTAAKYGVMAAGKNANEFDKVFSGLMTVVLGVVWPISWCITGLYKLGDYVEKHRTDRS